MNRNPDWIAIAQVKRTLAANPKLKPEIPMSADEKKPVRIFDQEFIDGAVKIVTGPPDREEPVVAIPGIIVYQQF